MAVHELFRRYPELEKVPIEPIASLPTPVEQMKGMRDATGLDIWVKRDDASGALYGGNKTRKLEFLFGDAKAQGKREVWTVGAIGSHHVLATCIWARHLGMECSALHFPQPITPHVIKNLKALSTTHPKLTLIGHKTGLPAALFKVKLKEWLSTGENIYYIPGGGSSPMGAIGYVNAAFELVRQFEELGEPFPEIIVVAAGTAGTYAGILLGLRWLGLSTRVVGVRVVERFICNKPMVVHLANQTADLLRSYGAPKVPSITMSDVELDHNQLGEGYGLQTPQGLKAIELARETHDLTLEPTYTAKAFGSILSHQKQWKGKRVLYWHTLNGADLTPLVEQYDPSGLPDSYQDFLEGA